MGKIQICGPWRSMVHQNRQLGIFSTMLWLVIFTTRYPPIGVPKVRLPSIYFVWLTIVKAFEKYLISEIKQKVPDFSLLLKTGLPACPPLVYTLHHPLLFCREPLQMYQSAPLGKLQCTWGSSNNMTVVLCHLMSAHCVHHKDNLGWVLVVPWQIHIQRKNVKKTLTI